ncbi:unnamed protein product [Protopolystoma xenopodis]|uniref:K Homology domain-containing protein n=1 Tax=Protopolystoma xenopodis TaxID=117903 RepID=A0A448X2G1_9PLAT|nr:unnamed protein product [Protopolystoma xenopodis]
MVDVQSATGSTIQVGPKGPLNRQISLSGTQASVELAVEMISRRLGQEASRRQASSAGLAWQPAALGTNPIVSGADFGLVSAQQTGMPRGASAHLLNDELLSSLDDDLPGAK